MWKIPKKIFFVGIGGISMSALAVILKSFGHEISGSDLILSKITQSLEQKGITVFEGHDKFLIDDFDIVVSTSAIDENNPQLVRARELGIPVISRAMVVGMLSRFFKNTIAVSGSHGKTTVTAMMTSVFVDAGLDPTVHIGGVFPKIAGNVRVGKGDIFVTEACEYCDSFLELSPKVSVVLNIKADHLDFFKNIGRLTKSFQRFAKNTKKSGVLISFGDEQKSRELFTNSKKISFGFKSFNDYYPKNITCDSSCMCSFDVVENARVVGRIRLSVPGKHNILNALATVAVARFFGIDFPTISASLIEFVGAERRFEHVSDWNGIKVIHDYCHHPTEIRATLKIAKQIAKGKVIAVFQPHTFSRTKSFFCAFAKSLKSADFVLLAPIYAAREKPIVGVTSSTLARKIRDFGGKAQSKKGFLEIFQKIEKIAKNGDVIMILGAGNVVEMCELFK